jgi:hypothetical protein
LLLAEDAGCVDPVRFYTTLPPIGTLSTLHPADSRTWTLRPVTSA